MDPRYDEIVRILRDVIVPLVEADGGEVFLLAAESSRVEIHLAGNLSGAPGNGLLCRRILEPAIRTVASDAEIILTAGWQIPEGAVRVQSCELKLPGDERANDRLG
jgi:Fe-S cluster biogenesis protein NfuA